jgi:transposase-like protein
MPDYDKVHKGLVGPYQKPYKEVCNGTLEKARDDLLRAIIKTLKHFGDMPLKIVLSIAEYLKQSSQGPLLDSSIDYDQMSDEIAALLQNATGSNVDKRGLGIAERVCKRQLEELQHGIYTLDITFQMVRNYVGEIYDSSFRELAPRKLRHYNGISHDTFKERLEEVSYLVQAGIDNIARQVIRRGGVQSLRKPARTQIVLPLNLEEDDVCAITG